MEEDEQRIWRRCEEEQQRLERSGVLLEDPQLEVYLQEVVCRLASCDPGGLVTFEVHVIRNPYLNAFAYPNGVLYVHTGFLSTIDNEGQLATILAHEMAHVTQRHAVRQFRDVKNKAAFFATLQVAAGSVGFGDLAGLMGQFGVMAAVTGYSRELEAEADVLGYERMVDAGYDPREAVEVFTFLEEELKAEERKEPFFFGTHPRVQERRENFVSLYRRSETGGSRGHVGGDQYRLAVRGATLDNAFLNLAIGRFDLAERDLDKYIRIAGEDGRTCFARGELCRQRPERCDVEEALSQYKKCLTYDPSYADAYKKLGWIYQQRGEDEIAGRFLADYLKILPDAPDKAFVQQALEEIEKRGGQ